MYDELIKQLRELPHLLFVNLYGHEDVVYTAAEAIEELQKRLDAVNDAHNEGYDVGYLAGRRDYEPKWIPVAERLPDSGQRVLAVGLHGEAMYIGTYTGGIKETAYRKAKPYKINAGGYGWRSFTWWMPLPQPPKEEYEHGSLYQHGDADRGLHRCAY